MKELEQTFKIEIKRLYEKALVQPLDMDEIKKLESLTRSWKAYSGSRIDDEESITHELTKEELTALANMEDD